MMVKRFVYSFSWAIKLCVTLLTSIVTAITCTHSYNHNAELNPVTSRPVTAVIACIRPGNNEMV